MNVSRVDLLGESAGGEILHIGLQASNDPTMALRMAEYSLRIYRPFQKFPKQIVLYVGEPVLRMKAALDGDDFPFRYTLRNLDGAQLLASSQVEDNLLALLTELWDTRATVREILVKIAALEGLARQDVLAQFLIISGLRRLGHTVEEEARKMPILHDILDHDLLGPLILQGRQEGLEEGKKQAVIELLEARIGEVPDSIKARVLTLSPVELKELFRRASKASSFDELFPAG